MATSGFGEQFVGDLHVYEHTHKHTVHSEAQAAAAGTFYWMFYLIKSAPLS